MSVSAIDLSGPLERLIYEVRGPIAIITLNCVERGNAMTVGMERALEAIWSEIRDSRTIRVAIITGAGERTFCTGGDVGDMSTDSEETALKNLPFRQAVRFSPHQNGVWKPVICAVNGLCNAGGLHFVVDSDIVLASENAVFMDTHTNLGLVGAIENVGLMRRLPVGTALRMTLQGKSYRLPARRAYELGLVEELVAAPADLLPKALEIAAAIAENSPQAVALSKQALWQSLELPYGQACENGWNLIRMHWNHPDFDEGPRAFGEKRKPVWNPNPNARRR